MCGNAVDRNVFAHMVRLGLIRIMRHLVFGAFIWCIVQSGVAQNEWLRLQPEDWLSLDKTQAGLSMLMDDPDAYSNWVWFEEGALIAVTGSQGQVYLRSGDLRVVLDSSGRNMSKSHNVGFNNGCKLLFWNDRCYAAGGHGFWQWHSKLVEFVEATGEWELQPTEHDPHHITNVSTWWNGEASKLVAIELPDSRTLEGTMAPAVRSLEFGTDWTWSWDGRVNPALAVHFSTNSLVPFDLKHYFAWVGLHKTLILDKRDMSYVFSDILNLRALDDVGFRSLSKSRYRHITTKNGEVQLRIIPSAGGEAVERTWDIRKAFQESSSQALSFVVPAEFSEDTVRPEERVAASWSPWLLALGLLALVLFATGFLFGQKRGNALPQPQSPDVKPSITTEDPKSRGPHQMSDLTRQFLDLKSPSFDTAELNQLLAFTEDLSEETRRARRAQAVRKVNQEYELWYNQPLIIRTKDTLDRRRTIYLIQRHSDNA